MSGDAGRRPEDLFDGYPSGLAICHEVERTVRRLGDATVTVSRSRVAFRRSRGFAYVWRPGQYVASDVPAVLSLALPHEVVSDRLEEVVHPSRGVWMHHLELHDTAEVDEQVRAWLAEAYESAG